MLNPNVNRAIYSSVHKYQANILPLVTGLVQT